MSIVIKDSYSRVNEGKQQSKQFIIYDLDSIARVNEEKKERNFKNVKKYALPRLDLAPFERPVRIQNPEL